NSPAAALDRGYIDWLKRAHDLNMSGLDAIAWARTRSFLDPDSGRWNAPGLGNNIHRISHDQERRMRAIDRAIAAHQEAIEPTPEPAPEESTADQIIFYSDLN
ncbi:hypothetical protein HC928_14640, partial [bacterium]|nr:hypothetical protein [bacterium]